MADAPLTRPSLLLRLRDSKDQNGDGNLTLWGTSTANLLTQVGWHWDDVYSVAFSPDGKTIASGSRGNRAKLWDVSRWTSGRK